MEAVTFIIKENHKDEDFNDYVEKANTVWEKALGRTYEYGECPSNHVIIGFNSEDEPVCACIFDTNLDDEEFYDDFSCYTMKKDECLISCVGAEPKNTGNGSKLMSKVIEFVELNKITKVFLNITKDKNKERLVKFYDKFGFNHRSHYGALEEYEIQRCLYL